MELYLILAGIWGAVVAFAPFGIWNAKARITDLEKETSTLRTELKFLKRLLAEMRGGKPATGAQEASFEDTNESLSAGQAEKWKQSSPQQVSYKTYEDETPAVTELFEATPDTNTHASEPETVPDSPADTPPKLAPSYDEPFLFDYIKPWFTGGKLFVTIGLILLFIGAAMLFKYVAHYIEVPIELRFMGVAAAALGMIAAGHRIMTSRPEYGLYLQGGGLGLLFLTVFAAFKFYSLLDPKIAFFTLVLIGACTIWLSVRYNSMPLAVLAVVGGFLAPILTSTGQGSHIALFSYYLLLNVVIFCIAWFKSWRGLNFTGFAFTFVIGLSWGGKYYVPEFYQSVQIFLILYFLLYVGVSLLFASRTRPNVYQALDAASIFGVPLIGFTLQMTLTDHFEYGIAISAAALSAFYGIVSFALKDTENEGWKLLRRIYAAFSIAFFSLAIPYAVDARATSSLWAVEGACLIWMYLQSRNLWYVRGGTLLILGSAIALLFNIDAQGMGVRFVNGFYMAGMLVTLSAWFGAFTIQKSNPSGQSEAHTAMLLLAALGLFGWFTTNLMEIHSLLITPETVSEVQTVLLPWLAFITVSSVAFFLLQKQFSVPLWEYPVQAVIYCMWLAAVLQLLWISPYHPFNAGGTWVWPLCFVLYYAFWLKSGSNTVKDSYHALAGVLLVLLCGFELGHHFQKLQALQESGIEPVISAQRIAGWLLASTCVLYITLIRPEFCPWPVMRHLDTYVVLGKFFWFWTVILSAFACLDSEITTMPGYIPILNIADAILVISVAIASISLLRLRTNPDTYPIYYILWILGAFSVFNSMLLKISGHILSLPYLSPSMFASVEVQTILTIVWTLLAMSLMIGASQKQVRPLWFLGAGLLCVVIAKLFLVDLAGVGTLSRIISFIGVGILTVLLGYFSPIPPKEEASVRSA
jgi:uncharacterized membrane protein